jgi:hypothetical protein
MVYYVGLQWKDNRRFARIVKSRDKGKTWQLCATLWVAPMVPDDRGYDYLDEPDLFISRKRWIVTHRYESADHIDGYLRQQTSDDQGKTWGPPKKTVMWGLPGYVIGMPDGRLVCTYGYRRPPFGIRAAVSRDLGETWDIGHEIVIRDDGGGSSQVADWDLGYPKTILLGKDRLFTVYYFNTKGTGCYIAGSFYALPK